MTNLLKSKWLWGKSFILLLVAVALCACDKQTVYHAFRSLPTEGWQRKDTLLFTANVPDSLTYYKMYVEIRNRNTYPYQNIHLSVTCQGPDTPQPITDTLNAVLATKEGSWKGDGWGGLYQTVFPAASIRIGQPGDYLFKIAYTFPDQALKGINDVGIKLER